MLRHNLNLFYKLSLREFSPHVTSLVRTCSTSSEVQQNILKYIKKTDPNTFGTLKKAVKDEKIIDEGDVAEEKFLEDSAAEPKRLSTKQYADIIKGYIRKRQIKEAIDVLEVRMLKEDRVKPENYIYNLLLGACGRVGYTKKAFSLFNNMKKRGLQPTGGTYTALFNACANSPWIEDGLSRATKLKQLMFEKGFQPNDTTCNSMIKAFGRCGDIQTAFQIVDEMIKNKIPIKTDSINFLLQSCITNKEVGFLHALLVWKKFKENRIRPDIYSFNLMLHCIRECSLGEPEAAKVLLEMEKEPNKQISGSVGQLQEPKSLENNKQVENTQNSLEIANRTDFIPNLLAPVPYLGNMVKLEEIKTAEHRLFLAGGCSGFLKNMENNKVTPEIKTFTMLLDNIPGTIAAEQILLSAMKKSKIKPDIDFLNMMIKKRSLRFDYKGAKEVLELFDKYNYRPNIFTYGTLALGCETLEESRALLQEMTDNGYRINIEILGALVRQACVKQNFYYVLEIMELALKEKINPNKIFLEHLKNLHTQCRRLEKSDTKLGKSWEKGFHLFRMRYKTWQNEVQPDINEETHPWQQFRQPVDTNIKNYKDPATHFKPRIKSRFKVKTGPLQ